MSSLRSVLDELEREDLDRVGDRALEDDFAEIERLARALQAERLRRLAEIHRRRTWERDGYLSTGAWLTHRFGLAWTGAARELGEADALRDMPLARSALREGELSGSAVQILVRAHDAHPQAFRAHEPVLVEAARSLGERDLRRAVAYWRQALDGPGSLRDAAAVHLARRLHLSPTLDGMVKLDGKLDAETGQTVMAAVDAVVSAEVRATAPDDQRTSAQRRADALGEVCRQWLDGSSRPEVGGERPHVTVTVDLEALRGAAGTTCELGSDAVIHPESARRLACDASVARVITGARSEPLDVGRRTAVVPPSIRRAVRVRDRQCRFPGCDRPPPWCDAHHILHWADGGPTALSNLVLLCRRHHRLVHEAGFRVTMEGATPVFRRPDGTALALSSGRVVPGRRRRDP